MLDWLRARVHADFAALDRDLTGQQFLLGAAVSVADISCIAYLLHEDLGLDLSHGLR